MILILLLFSMLSLKQRDPDHWDDESVFIKKLLLSKLTKQK